jgi:hypothetical protein
MNSPLPEPAYVTSLDELFWGTILVTITLTMHGFGMLAVLRANLYVKKWLGEKTHIVVDLFPVILASWMILLVHLTEVLVWALFFIWKGAFVNPSVAYYFSLNEYTTVGSNFNLPLHWRLLEGMLATAGLLSFAWSTGMLMTLAQEFQDRHLQWFKRQHGPDGKSESHSQVQPPKSR